MCVSGKPVFLHQPSGAHEARERCALSGRHPIPRHPLRGAHELQMQYAVSGLGSFALCGARERCAAPALGQKGRDTYGFPPSLNSYLSLGNLANEPYGSTS